MVRRKILVGGKLASHELFIKIFIANIHRYTENVFGICTDFKLFAKVSLPIALPVWFAKIFPHQNCTVPIM